MVKGMWKMKFFHAMFIIFLFVNTGWGLYMFFIENYIATMISLSAVVGMLLINYYYGRKVEEDYI